MVAERSRDGSVFKQSFAEHWTAFQHAHPRSQTSSYDGLVAQRLACGHPATMGYGAYRCLQCGQGKPLVAMRCPSSLCWRCAKVSGDNWVSQVSKVLHEGVLYRPIVLTVPAMFRTTFSRHAAVLLRALMRCGAQGLADVSSTSRGQALKGGSSTVLHPPGRHGQYHPQRHLLAPSGGDDARGARWEHLQYLPYALLRRKWQWHLLTLLRPTLQTDAIHPLVEACFRHYPNGLVTNVHKGPVPLQAQSVARYVAQSVVSPPIAVRRIERYDGARVTYHDRSHRTDRMAYETVTVATLIGRMVQPRGPKGFKRIR
jgi:Putative transposase/Transposase zinc-binding domain